MYITVNIDSEDYQAAIVALRMAARAYLRDFRDTDDNGSLYDAKYALSVSNLLAIARDGDNAQRARVLDDNGIFRVDYYGGAARGTY